MRTRSGKGVVALLAICAGAAAFSARAVDGAPASEADAPVTAQLEQYHGVSVPRNATDLLVPEASFRVGGWASSWGVLKVLELAKDGEPVREGQVIARFEFIGREALRMVEEDIQKAEAEAAQARITADQTLEGLQVEERRLALEARLAAVDIQKAPLVSKKQQALFDIRHRIAQFEADAARQKVWSATQARNAELAFQDQTVARAHQNMARYKFYEKRFALYAPHDGVVRHAFHAQERRKVQKADSIRPGQKLASVAKDDALSVRFYVPEHRVHELRKGMAVIATSASGEEVRAVVREIDFFPQELGFLMELPTLPNAREKAFAVLADFVEAPAGLTAGTELKVKVVPGAPATAKADTP